MPDKTTLKPRLLEAQAIRSATEYYRKGERDMQDLSEEYAKRMAEMGLFSNKAKD